MRPAVLFVDDEHHITDALKRALRKEPYDILTANSAAEALEVLGQVRVDVIVADEKMPGMSGLELLNEVHRLYPGVIQMMLTGHAALETALEATSKGQLRHFLSKPCQSAELSATIACALRQKALLHGAVVHPS